MLSSETNPRLVNYAFAQTSAPFSTNSFDFASMPFFKASSLEGRLFGGVFADVFHR